MVRKVTLDNLGEFKTINNSEFYFLCTGSELVLNDDSSPLNCLEENLNSKNLGRTYEALKKLEKKLLYYSGV